MNLTSTNTHSRQKDLFDVIGVFAKDSSNLHIFDSTIHLELPSIVNHSLEDQFILIDGDGCFTVNFLADKKLLFGLHITGHTSARELLEKIKHKLHCGVVQVKNKGTLRYQVDSINAIRDQVIPFVDKYKLFTNKAIHYSIFKQVVNLVKSGSHLSDDGFLKIMDLAYDMNLEGKPRKLTKQEYIERFSIVMI